MFPLRPVSARSAVPAALLLGSALVLSAAPAGAQVMNYGGWGPPSPPWAFEEPRARVYYRSFSSRQIADILYRYYGAAQVLIVRPAGDVFEAEIVDRRGFRVRYTFARDTAEVLDRSVVGSARWDAPVPVPPRAVPQPRQPERAAPAPREARAVPDRPAADRPASPRVQDAPAVPAPRVAPVERKPLPEPPLAARPSGPAAEPVAPPAAEPARAPAKPELAKPPQLQPPAAPAQAPPVQAPPSAARPEPTRPAATETRVIQPPPRIPEPLTDPRTGQPNARAGAAGAIPVAPLDDTSSRPRTPVTIPPPAALD